MKQQDAKKEINLPSNHISLRQLQSIGGYPAKQTYYKQLGTDIFGATVEEEAEYYEPGNFGFAVATNEDGSMIAIGSPADEYYCSSRTGKVYVYKLVDGDWVDYGIISGPYFFGYDVKMSADGTRIAVVKRGDFYGEGAFVEVFDLNVTDDAFQWDQVGKIRETRWDCYYYNCGCGDRSSDVELSLDGRFLIFGGGAVARVFTFDETTNDWVQVGDTFSVPSWSSFALNEDGSRITIANDDAYPQLYDLVTNETTGILTWVEFGPPCVTDDVYPYAVKMSANGNRIVVSGNSVTEIFDLNPTSMTWTQLGASLEGRHVGINKDASRMALGDNDYYGDTGYTRIFQYNIGKDKWVQLGSVITGDNPFDEFGRTAMSSDGNRVVIGAPGNDERNNNSGHVRVFELDYYPKLNIFTNYDFDGKAANWCLEPVKVKRGKPLQVRKCFNSKKKQVWIYDINNQIRSFDKPWLCVVWKGRTVIMGSCNNDGTTVEGQFLYNSTINSLYVVKDTGTFRVGVDKRNDWKNKRLRLFGASATNPSLDTWHMEEVV